MKHKKSIIFTMLTALFALSASATTTISVDSKKKFTAVGNIITDVEGTRQNMTITASGYYIYGGLLEEYNTQEMFTHIVYQDNDEVFFYNILPYAETNTYVKGIRNGDRIVLNLPQTVYKLDGEGYELDMCLLEKNFDDGLGSFQFNVTNIPSLTFSILKDGSIVADGISDNLILGLTYSDSEDSSWSGYGASKLSMVPYKDEPVTVPDGIEITKKYWIYEAGDYGWSLNWAQDYFDVYFQGISQIMPEAWIKGEVEYHDYDASILIAQNQYLGDYDGNHVYTKCAKLVFDEDGNLKDCETLPADYKYVLVWNYENNTIVSEDSNVYLLLDGSKEQINYLQYIKDVKLIHQNDFRGIPSNPNGLTFDGSGYSNEDNSYGVFQFYVPAVSTEGDYLDTDNLSYVVYVDGEEWDFYASDYDLEEDMVEIPWDFGADYIYNYGGTRREVDFFIEGISTLGVQSVYNYDGEETRSEIVTIDLDSLSAISNFEYKDIWYSIINTETRTCKTKDGHYDKINKTTVSGNDCRGNILIPEKVSDGVNEYTVTEIGQYGFSGCSSLTAIEIPATVTSIGRSAFEGCTELSAINIPELVTSIAPRTFWGCLGLTTIDIPESVISIGESAFMKCSGLKSVTIPGYVTSIGGTAFYYCDNVKSVTYTASTPIAANDDVFHDNVYIEATLNMPHASLESIKATVPWNKFIRINAADGSIAPAGEGEDFEYEGIWYTVVNAVAKTCKTKEGHYESPYTFAGNMPEGEVDIPAVVSDGVYEYTVIEIGAYGFHGSEIVSVKIPETVTTIGPKAFNVCSELTSVSIPESVTSIGTSAFGSCLKLTSIHLPDGLTNIDSCVFQGCQNLSEVNMPKSLTTVESCAFNACAMTLMELPDGVQHIGYWSFQNNPLVTVTIPGSLTSADEQVFNRCYLIEDVTYLANIPVELDETLFMDEIYEKAILHAPNATVASIQATAPWNRFARIIASDGIDGFVSAGDDFEFDGIQYTVTDTGAKTCKTKDAANKYAGDLAIPSTVSYEGEDYSVTEIGAESFAGSSDLRSVTLPASIDTIGTNAFADCERLTSLVWQSMTRLASRVIYDIDNPNLLVYVNVMNCAPTGLEHNVVANGICEHLVLTPDYPFAPLKEFTATRSEITKPFDQQTPLEGCSGWESMTIPFEPSSITASDGRQLVPFAAFTDFATQCPFWLYEADEAGEWKEASAIRPSVPYIISMPNNDEYDEQYRIDGNVTFYTDTETIIAPETCAPYAVTWNSGREFRSIWLPLTEAETANSLGLNAGISGLTNDEGELLAPGSAFHTDVLPKPLEAYVTRIDMRRAMPVRGGQSFVSMLSAGEGFRIAVDLGTIILSSDRDRTADVMTTDGIVIRHVALKAGEPYRIDNLTRGIYIVAGRKMTVK